jgi:hypothetical protein
MVVSAVCTSIASKSSKAATFIAKQRRALAMVRELRLLAVMLCGLRQAGASPIRRYAPVSLAETTVSAFLRSQ